MYIEESQMIDEIPFPKGSVITVLGEEKSRFSFLETKYKLVQKIQDDTRFVIVVQSGESTLNLYNATRSRLPFCIVGERVENELILDVLWHETTPFITRLGEPLFMVKTGNNRLQDITFCTRLLFALGEKITQEILLTGETETSIPKDFSVSFLQTNKEEIYSIVQTLKGRIDGLKQAENALILLKTKEKSIFNRLDCLVLLAKNLAKVYNYFIKELPLSPFAPNNVQRMEMLQEFFAIPSPTVRRIVSEYESRKSYYMISQNREILLKTWERIYSMIEEYFALSRPLTSHNGFCLEEYNEDIKFATFMAPDILSGETLLSLIKDCGIGDNFI